MESSANLKLKPIYFDLETTDFIRGGVSPEIISFAAIGEEFRTNPNEKFNEKMVPTCVINPGASSKNGFTKIGNTLCFNDKPQDAGHPRDVLTRFVEFLDKLSEHCENGEKIVLVSLHFSVFFFSISMLGIPVFFATASLA